MINSQEILPIALITPVKDEIENLDRFFETISNLNTVIKLLVVIENDSVDGSKEYLEKLKSVKNIIHFEVIHMCFADTTYDIEFKYAEIISKGLNYIKSQPFYKDIDYIGILDSDCFPEEAYYSKLVHFLKTYPKTGITSGIIYTDEGKVHKVNPHWVRGGCRLWVKKCIEDTGFPIAPSPDAITVALAQMKGWKPKNLKTAIVYSREVNERMPNYLNFGKRVYYRGSTPFFAILKTFHYFTKLNFKIGKDFFWGYFSDYIKQNPKIENYEVRKYYNNYLLNKIIRKY